MRLTGKQSSRGPIRLRRTNFMRGRLASGYEGASVIIVEARPTV
jgi:hypothetical protein